MGSDPGDGWPRKGEYYDEDLGEWFAGDRPAKHHCAVEIGWKPKGKKTRVWWSFREDDTYEDTAKLARLIEDSDGFAEECVPSNVTKGDVETASILIQCIVEALHEGDRATLDRLGAVLALIDDPAKPESGRDARRAQFVDVLKEHVIKIQRASDIERDKLVSSLIRHLERYSQAFAKLDHAMVKDAVASIDPHNNKGGRGKKGPPWLAARLIVAANAGDEFDLPRPTETDEGYFDYVLQSLQNACRPGRGKPKASTKKP